MKILSGPHGEDLCVEGISPEATIRELKRLVASNLPVLSDRLDQALLLASNGKTTKNDDLVSSHEQLFLFAHGLAEKQSHWLAAVTRAVSVPEPTPDGLSIQPNLPPQLAELRKTIYRQYQHARNFAAAAQTNLADIVDGANSLRGHLRLQLESEQVLRANLEHYYGLLRQMVEPFQAQTRPRMIEYTSLLDSFLMDAQKLKETPLYISANASAVAAAGNLTMTLWDYANGKEGNRMETWAERCRSQLEKIKVPLAEINQMMEEIVAIVQSQRTSQCVPRESIDAIVDAAVALLAGQKGFSDNLAKQFDSISSVCKAPSMARSDLSVYDELIHKSDASILPQMRKNQESLVSLMAELAQKHEANRVVLCERLRQNEEGRRRMGLLKQKLDLYEKPLAKLDEDFEQLRICQRLPEAYKWGLMEVVRRRHFQRVALSRVVRFYEEALRAYRHEKRQRETFRRQYGRYLMEDLIPGFEESLPCEHAIQSLFLAQREFSTHLPDLHMPQQVVDHFNKVATEHWGHQLGEPLLALGYKRLELSIEDDVDHVWRRRVNADAEGLGRVGTSNHPSPPPASSPTFALMGMNLNVSATSSNSGGVGPVGSPTSATTTTTPTGTGATPNADLQLAPIHSEPCPPSAVKGQAQAPSPPPPLPASPLAVTTTTTTTTATDPPSGSVCPNQSEELDAARCRIQDLERQLNELRSQLRQASTTPIPSNGPTNGEGERALSSPSVVDVQGSVTSTTSSGSSVVLVNMMEHNVQTTTGPDSLPKSETIAPRAETPDTPPVANQEPKQHVETTNCGVQTPEKEHDCICLQAVRKMAEHWPALMLRDEDPFQHQNGETENSIGQDGLLRVDYALEPWLAAIPDRIFRLKNVHETYRNALQTLSDAVAPISSFDNSNFPDHLNASSSSGNGSLAEMEGEGEMIRESPLFPDEMSDSDVQAIVESVVKVVSGWNIFGHTIRKPGLSFGDVAVFIRKEPRRDLAASISSMMGSFSRTAIPIYEAVPRVDVPCFLTRETTQSFFKQMAASAATMPPFVVVRVVQQLEMEASDENPYGLAVGRTYVDVIGELVYDPIRQKDL